MAAAPVRIRTATDADLPEMQRAKREAGIAAWRHIFPAPALHRLPWPERWTESMQAGDARTQVLVAEQQGTAIGFAIVRPSADDDADESTGELDALYVAPEAWGRGIGQALVASAMDRMRNQGFRTATLWTAAENTRPRRIYEQAGWRLDGAVRDRKLEGVAFRELRYRIAV